MSPQNNTGLTFADLFAGIGGFHQAMHAEGIECVFVSEWDHHARATYEANYADIAPAVFGCDRESRFVGDITKVTAADMPDFDILTGGFPCQPFSLAGKRKGFGETRGTLFFDVARIIDEKRPSAFILENVRGLLSHDDGRTFATIKKVITEDLGYSLHWKVLKGSEYGVPQLRPRLYMVGFADPETPFSFPDPVPLEMTMADVFGADEVDREVGFTLRCGGRKSGLGDRRNWDTYLVDGEVRHLGPVEGLRMQGFPDDFAFPVSETQAMKQLGNSVAVPVVRAVVRSVVASLDGGV